MKNSYLCYLFIIFWFHSPGFSADCDMVIRSDPNAPRDGIFQVAENLNPNGHTISCKFTFIARPNERIKLSFENFNLRGTPPECNHEYIDIYTEFKNSDKINVLDAPFGGRYCGRIPPRVRVSLYQAAVIVFYTDFNTTGPELFLGAYRFFNASRYEIGTNGADNDCGYIIHSDVKTTGVFLSPTYPGIYPKNISCYWKFSGRKGQRIRIEFRDFDLFYGGAHCPFDKVKIYDGPDQTSSLIGTYCGQQRHLVIFSGQNSLMVTFNTIIRTADSQNRGFQGLFNFSEEYLSLDFIHKNEAKNNAATHIPGSECDQKILSKGRSNGTVFSPNYPFPYYPKVICRYFIYGLEDAQNLERVSLTFHEQFQIPAIPDSDSNCSDGFLRLYLQGQETRRRYDSPDYVLCGKNLPSSVTSMGPRLLMVFSSGSSQGKGFKATYQFMTEYQVPGTSAPDGSCNFIYNSQSSDRGAFNSPRHPANYPSNIYCSYTFWPGSGEQVQVVFNQFKVRNEIEPTNHTGGSHCVQDYVEIYQIFKDKDGSDREEFNGRYCKKIIPGPITNDIGSAGIRVYLTTDSEGVFSGFQGEYLFKKSQVWFDECGGNATNQEWGEIKSPNWPENYGSPSSDYALTCNWFIHVKKNHKILVWFSFFSVEGNPADRGCPAAVFRIWPTDSSLATTLCGDELTPDTSQFLSHSNTIRMSFTTAPKAVGSAGFKIVWTEIKDSPICEDFLCIRNNFCISKELRCNNYQNCGYGDHSDEQNCHKSTEVNVLMLVGMCVGISCTVLLIFCLYCQRRRSVMRRKKALPDHSRACERGARFASMDDDGRNLSPVIGTRKELHHLSCGSIRDSLTALQHQSPGITPSPCRIPIPGIGTDIPDPILIPPANAYSSRERDLNIQESQACEYAQGATMIRDRDGSGYAFQDSSGW